MCVAGCSGRGGLVSGRKSATWLRRKGRLCIQQRRAEWSQYIRFFAEKTVTKEDLIAQADALAATYDYDGAIELLKSAEGSATDSDMIAKISEYTTAKDACVRVDINQVTHIFYHSLVVDPQKAFFQDNKQTEGFCEWMTTVEEFNRITQQMYDNGYVLVALHDLVKQTVDENGTVHFTEGDIIFRKAKSRTCCPWTTCLIIIPMMDVELPPKW